MIKLFFRPFFILFLILIINKQVKAQSENAFTLNGKIEGKKSGSIYLVTYDAAGARKVDSSKIVSGNFIFKGEMPGYSDKVYLKLDPKELRNADSLNTVEFQLEDSEMSIQLQLNHFSQYVLKGCEACDEKVTYEKSLLKNDSIYNLINDDEINVKQKVDYQKLYDSLEIENFKTTIDFIATHPNSKLSPKLLFWSKIHFNESNFQKFIKVYKALSAEGQNSFYGLKSKIKIDEYLQKVNQVGKRLPAFSGVSLKGDLINNDEFSKHKLTLIDFWASFCAPCRKGNPVLVGLYNEYHSQSFEIIAISDDYDNETDRKKWLDAIQQDGVSAFIHLLFKDLKTLTWETANGSSNLFFTALPTRILVNQEGIIVGRHDDESTDELMKKINAYFNQ